MIIETEHLIMRIFENSDIEDAYRYLSNNEVMYYIEDVFDYQQTAKFVDENINENPNIYALVEKCSDKVIGHIIFHRYGHEKIFELGWIIGNEFQGKGYAYEISNEIIKYAFGTLKIHKIISETIEHNIKSIALMRKLGMKQEAVFRQQNWDHDNWVDEYWYGLLESDI